MNDPMNQLTSLPKGSPADKDTSRRRFHAPDVRTPYFRAELLRSWRTFTMRLPAIMVAIAGLLAFFSFGVNASRLASSHFYGALLLAPLAAVTGVVGQAREERYRQGGTAWRNVSLPRLLTARATVVGLYVLIGHALMTAILAAHPAEAVQFCLVSTIDFLVFWAFGVASWRLLPRAALLIAPIAAAAWNVAGVLSMHEETITDSTWVFMPWTWAVRPTLPTYGVLPTSEVAPTNSPIWDINIAPPLVLHALVGVALFAVALLPTTAHAAERVRRAVTASQEVSATPATTATAGGGIGSTTGNGAERGYDAKAAALTRRASLSRGLALTLPWRTWIGLAVLMLGALVVLRARYGIYNAIAFFSFVCVPAAASIVAIMAWTTQNNAWPALMYRKSRSKLLVRLFMLEFTFLVPVLLLAASLSGAGAGPEVDNGYRWIYQAMVIPFVAAMILSVIGALARWSVPGATFLSIALTAWSVLIGGDVLNSGPMWWTSAWSWVWTVRDYPERWVAVALASTIITVVALILNNRLLRVKM